MTIDFSTSTITLTDFITLIVAAATFIVALLTLISQKNTERNTIPLISQESQEIEFRILIRFLLKNLVQSIAIFLCLENRNYKSYPSEIHISEQFISIENLHLHLFYKNDELTSMLSKLSISLNQYNSSINVIAKHLTDPNIPVEIKREEIQRFQINGVLIILDELKKFVDKVYSGLNICETEFVNYFNPWKEDIRIHTAFGTHNQESFKEFKEQHNDTFDIITEAIANDEFRNFLSRFSISKTNQEQIINGVICSIAHQIIGRDPRSHPILITHNRNRKVK